jgi:hypothetical protein
VQQVASIIEQYLQGKNPADPEGGEDHIVHSADFIALFDGVTSRGRAVSEGLRLDGMSPGRWAAVALGAAVLDLPPDVDALTASSILSSALADGQTRLGINPEEWGWPAAAQITVFSKHRMEVWRIGDAHVAVNGVALPDNPTPLDGPAVAFRSAVLWAMIAGGATPEDLKRSDPSWDMLLPLLELQHHLRNAPDTTNPFAYGLLDGRQVDESFVQIYPVCTRDEVVFASDGYLSPAATLEEAEGALASCLAEDPLLIGKHLGFRPVADGMLSFDDRSYVRFTA